MATTFADAVTFSGTATFTNTVTLPSLVAQLPAGIPRAALTQDDLKAYPILPHQWRIHNAIGTGLPTPSASDDLGIYPGPAALATFGTHAPVIQSYDVKAANSVTMYARTFFEIPPEYVAGQTVEIQARCQMTTAVAGTSAVVDFEAHEIGDDGTVGADIVATAQQDINSLTPATKTFTITPTNLTAGDMLDIRMMVTTVDAAGGTAVFATILWVKVCCDVKG
jgi:hypothetical protein